MLTTDPTAVSSPTANDNKVVPISPATSPESPQQYVQLFPCTDAGNAELIAQLYGERLTYDFVQGRWLEWVSSHEWSEHPPHQRHRWVERRAEEMHKFAIEAARRRIDASNRMTELEKRKAQPGDLIKAWVGHSSLRTTSRYTHFGPNFRQQTASEVGLLH